MKLCKKSSQFRIGRDNHLAICYALIILMTALNVPAYADVVYTSTASQTWTGTPTIYTMNIPLAATAKDTAASDRYAIGQSFTVLAGSRLVLDKIALMADGGQSFSDIRIVDLGTSFTDGGVTPTTYPAGTNLLSDVGAVTLPATGASVKEFDFTGDDEIVLEAGHTYVFELVTTTPAGGFWWHRNGTAGYSVYEGGDFYFAYGSIDATRTFPYSDPNRRRDLAMAIYLIGGFNWGGTVSNSWADGGNWQGTTSPTAGAINEELVFGSRDSGDMIITDVDGAYTDIEGISFSGASGNYTITGTGSFDITAGGIVGQGETGNTHTITVEFITNSGGGILFNGADNLTINGIVSGDGDITKEGTGVLLFNGDNTYTGATTISAGTLSINGSIVSEATVNGGRLMGIGTITNNVTVNSGGTAAPGNSIGILTIDGDYLQDTGAILEAEVLKVGSTLTSDLLDVTGTATLELNSTINVVNLSSPVAISDGDTFTIISAASGITDNGADVIHNSVILSFTGDVVGNDYVITADTKEVSSNNNLALFETINEDYFTATDDFADIIAILDTLGDAAINNAAEMLSPLMHGSVRDFNIQMTQDLASDLTSYLAARRHGTEYMAKYDSLRQNELLMADASGNPQMLTYVVGETERLRQQLEDADREIHTFFRPFGVWSNHDSTEEYIGFQAQSFGSQFGFDKIFRGNWILGFGGSYNHSSLDFDKGAGEATIDSFRVGPYASYFEDRWHIDVSATVGYHINKTERDIKFPGVNRTADADYISWDFSAYAGAGYDFSFKKWTLTPSASIQYTRYRNEAFEEEGAEDAGLDIGAATQESLLSNLGFRLYTNTTLYDMRLAPELFVGYSHEFMDQESISSRFMSGTSKFSTNIDNDRKDSFYYGAGLTGLLSDKTSAFFRYECESFGGSDNSALKAGLTIIF